MMRISKSLVLVLGCSVAAACAEGGEPFEGDSLRAAGEEVDFWNFRPNDPGNGDVVLSDDDDLMPMPIWEIDGAGDGTDVFDPSGNLVLATFENQIYDPAGNIQCTAYLEGDLYKLREGSSPYAEVILTATQGRYVFWGDVPSLPEPGTAAWQELIYTQLAYEFYGEKLYDGPRWIADVISVADVKIHRANPMRKLLIAALFEGACGTVEPLPPPG